MIKVLSDSLKYFLLHIVAFNYAVSIMEMHLEQLYFPIHTWVGFEWLESTDKQYNDHPMAPK